MELTPPEKGLLLSQIRAIKAAGLPYGYDEDYRDLNGRAPGERGFIPPVYTDNYADENGRHVGEAGFIPPSYGSQRALQAGEYTDAYRDANFRCPGERGFIPPLCAQAGMTAVDMERELAQGFDSYYRDPAGRKPGDVGFVFRPLLFHNHF